MRKNELTPEERKLADFYIRAQLKRECEDAYVLSGKWREAVRYAINQKESLLRLLDDGRLQLSNNLAEQKIRPLAIGRKNYLFLYSEEGAHSNAIAYTLIETAKAHGLNTLKYLEYLFKELPNISFQRNKVLLEDFLPWNEFIQAHCR